MQDPLLKAVVAMADQAGIETGVTLYMAGGIISGTLISQKRYLDQVANGFADAWPGGPNEDIRHTFSTIGDVGEHSDEIANMFIHLKDARAVSTKGFLPSAGEGAYWRGKVEAITGFNFGAYKP